MKVIVCGAGQVGFNIAKRLAHQHNDVTVIDRSPELIRKVGESLDVQALEGYASDPDLLERANAAEADMIIAVTWSDEVNMIACQVAHSLFDVPTKIARIRNQSYLRPTWQNLFGRDNLPIDVVISPEVEVARSLARRLEAPGAFEMEPFADDKVRLVGIRIGENCPVVDTPLRQLTELFPDLSITVLAVVRDRKLFVPAPEDHVAVRDSIYFAVDKKHVMRSMAVFGYEEKEARRIVIVGGGNVGMFLAKELGESDHPVNIKIIESSHERAEFLGDQIPKSVVIEGDGLDSEILKEAGVETAETLVAVANDDEVNILSSLLAKRLGALRTIALINNPAYGPLMSSLGVDVYVDPRETTVSTILQHIRRGRIRGLFSIRGGEAEVIEAEALETTPLVGKTIHDMELPDGVMIGAVVRDGEVIMPRGGTTFEIGDRIIVLAMADAVKKVEQLFAVRLEFF
jgi:trk system potassium uptake protein TrkA